MENDYQARRRWLKENNFELDLDALRDWLKIWLEDLTFERADLLKHKWLHIVPAPGSEWTQEDELQRWIVASTDDPIAWEGLLRLLKKLPDDDVPHALRDWVFDAQRGLIEEPKRTHGQHATDYTWRNARIANAVTACRSAGLTLEEACREVAKIPGTPADQQVQDIYKETRKTGSVFDGIETVIGPLPPQGA